MKPLPELHKKSNTPLTTGVLLHRTIRLSGVYDLRKKCQRRMAPQANVKLSKITLVTTKKYK
ncbi:hypothetical protein, partial [Pandoraea sputorum]|uniref:hypothetical protein n=1 Tax=Pandoraea sputorum TaxID=93222 RepID=UPI002F3EA7ED